MNLESIATLSAIGSATTTVALSVLPVVVKRFLIARDRETAEAGKKRDAMDAKLNQLIGRVETIGSSVPVVMQFAAQATQLQDELSQVKASLRKAWDAIDDLKQRRAG